MIKFQLMKFLFIIRKHYTKAFNVLFWIIIVTIITRFFFLDVFHIPSASMENTFVIDDYIVVNKFCCSNPLSKLMNKTKYTRNDILVFMAGKNHTTFVKRCIGLPGEEIKITNSSEVYIDGNYISPPETSCRYRKVWYQNYSDLLKCIDKRDITQKYSNYVIVNLDKNEEMLLSSCGAIDSIGKLEEVELYKNSLLGYSSHSDTKIDYLLIPYKGLKIDLDSCTVRLYKDILEKEETVSIEWEEGYYWINKKRDYIFKYDYYFMVGDNRNQSTDSRSYGPVKANNIIGKVLFPI